MRLKNSGIMVFDLDDTLYPETQFVESGFQTVSTYLKNNGIVSGDLFHAMWKKFCEGARRTIFNDVLKEAGAVPDDNLIKKIVDVFRYHSPAISLYPDAISVLNRFHMKKKMGLLTDGYLQMQRNKVNALKIERFFDAVVFTDELGGSRYWKPHTAGYRKIMDLFSVSGKDCLYVGDNPKKDFFGARKLGWRTVRIKRADGIYRDENVAGPDYQADILITDLNELSLIIEHP